MSTATFTPHRVSFPVADVKPGTNLLPEISMRAAVERTLHRTLIVCREPNEKVVETGDFHPLIAAAALAYKQHYPLVLSPDMLWLTILQGVAQHVANHPESLRSKLVAHQTRIELVVDTELSGFPETDSEMLLVTSEFISRIERHLAPDKRFLLRTDFTTTTDVERIAGAIVLMDAFQPYFDYVFACICGIPSVTLEGTAEDWKLLTAKVRLLHESDLDLTWWTKHLLPLCEEFVHASQSDVDQPHWHNLLKLAERYGYEELNGWLLKFIPYVRQERNEAPRHRNPMLELTDYEMSSERMGAELTGCIARMLPSGLSAAPVTCMIRDTVETVPCQFVSGFTGVVQSHADQSLRPAIGWAIAPAAQIDRLLDRLRREHDVHPPQPTGVQSLLQTLDGNFPADLWRFYSEIDGATLNFSSTGRKTASCFIRGVGQIQPVVDFNSVERELKLLCKRGILIPNEYDERRRFALSYSRLRAFAEVYEGQEHFIYAFGDDPERFDGRTFKESRGTIFRWTGEPTREAFEPVANSFSEWLEAMLESKAP